MEYYLTLAKNSKGLALVDTIHKLLSAQNIINFKPMLDLQACQSLKDSNPPVFKLLQLFTFGNLGDYTSEYPELNSNQMRNLKILTLLSIISKTSSFDDMKAAIKADNDMELEDLLIEMLERHLIDGTINQQQRALTCYYKHPRATSNETQAVENLTKRLNQWVKNIDSITQEIDLLIQKEDERLQLQDQENQTYELLVKEAMEKAAQMMELEGTMGSSSNLMKRNERKREREKK